MVSATEKSSLKCRSMASVNLSSSRLPYRLEQIVKRLARMYQAEVTGTGRNIVMVISSNDPQIRFSRSFSSICEVERWLYRLIRKGLCKRDYQYLSQIETHSLELPPLVSIAVCDKRSSRRFELPTTFS